MSCFASSRSFSHIPSAKRQHSPSTTWSPVVAVVVASDPLLVLSAAEPDKGALLYSAPLGEAKGTPTLVANVTAACEDPPNLVVQGKAHVPLVEDASGGRVYFASHVGFYTEVDGMETLPVRLAAVRWPSSLGGGGDGGGDGGAGGANGGGGGGGE